jgi:tetratricopeptide (TPR) repeat protein
MWHVYRYSAEDIATARGLFEQAISMDPTFAPAHAALAYVSYAEVIFGYADDPEANIRNGLRTANEALALDSKDPAAHSYLGRILTQVGDHEPAMAEFDAALALNPSFAMAHYGRGLVLTFQAHSEEALEAIQTAMRLSPHDPQMWLFEMVSAIAEIQRGNNEEALAWGDKSVRHPAAGFYAHVARAVALAYLGRDTEAQVARDKALELKPDMSFAFLQQTWPNWDEAAMKTVAEGMAKAGFVEPQ